MSRIKSCIALIVVFIMGIPMATQAKAQEDAGDIVESALGLTFAIVDVAGDS